MSLRCETRHLSDAVALLSLSSRLGEDQNGDYKHEDHSLHSLNQTDRQLLHSSIMTIEMRELFGSKSSRLSLHSVDRSERSTLTPRKARFQSGWRFGLFAGAASCTVVFAVNLFATIWAATRDQKNMLDQPVLQEGPCSDMRHMNTGLHLIINALSSILLAASNYGMQCISAPTRVDVDKAHFEGKWLDIGVPSVHNLRRLPTERVVLWGLLMFSSLPLHLV